MWRNPDGCRPRDASRGLRLPRTTTQTAGVARRPVMEHEPGTRPGSANENVEHTAIRQSDSHPLHGADGSIRIRPGCPIPDTNNLVS